MAWHSTWNDPPRRRGFFVDRGGMFPPGVLLILILTFACFVLEAGGQARPLVAYGSLTAYSLLHLEVWRLVTYMFLHASIDHILLNMLVFWMLGMVFERQIGTRPFLGLYLASGIAGGLCECAFNVTMYVLYGHEGFLGVPAVGASAGVAGILVAFATLNPRARFLIMFILPMEAWLAAVLYVLYETWPVVAALMHGPSPTRDDNVAHAAHFGGAMLGFVWMRWGGALGDLLRRGPPMRIERRRDPLSEDEEDEEDRILQKIHDEGIDGLTVQEKMFLQEMTRRRQGRR